MLRFLRFFLLLLVKYSALLFFRFEEKWLPQSQTRQWKDVNFIILLNHTSLFEPIFVALAPVSFLWRMSKHLTMPGADVTLARPLTGKILHLLVPGCIPITRKKDKSWEYFLSHVDETKINAIFPEGRMRRKDGLDKHGLKMDIRSGVVDMLKKLEEGHILFIYSGGLHHIQTPGDKLPNLFKTVQANMEVVDLKSYKNNFDNERELFKKQVIKDMNDRLAHYVPK